MSDAAEVAMQRELTELLDSSRSGDLEPSDFAARLGSLHARFLGAKANTPERANQRRDATTAYDDLIAGTDMDRHHHVEKLAEALDLRLRPGQ